MLKYLSVLCFICVVINSCKKSSEPSPPNEGKSIVTTSPRIYFSSGYIVSIDFRDGTKSANLQLVPQPIGSGNASVTVTKTTLASSGTMIKPSPYSGEDVDASPLDESDTVTIELDLPLRALNGEAYKKVTITKFDLASFYVGYTQVPNLTSSAQASAAFPLGKAALNTKAARLAGRYAAKID